MESLLELLLCCADLAEKHFSENYACNLICDFVKFVLCQVPYDFPSLLSVAQEEGSRTVFVWGGRVDRSLVRACPRSCYGGAVVISHDLAPHSHTHAHASYGQGPVLVPRGHCDRVGSSDQCQHRSFEPWPRYFLF